MGSGFDESGSGLVRLGYGASAATSTTSQTLVTAYEVTGKRGRLIRLSCNVTTYNIEVKVTADGVVVHHGICAGGSQRLPIIVSSTYSWFDYTDGGTSTNGWQSSTTPNERGSVHLNLWFYESLKIEFRTTNSASAAFLRYWVELEDDTPISSPSATLPDSHQILTVPGETTEWQTLLSFNGYGKLQSLIKRHTSAFDIRIELDGTVVHESNWSSTNYYPTSIGRATDWFWTRDGAAQGWHNISQNTMLDLSFSQSIVVKAKKSTTGAVDFDLYGSYATE